MLWPLIYKHKLGALAIYFETASMLTLIWENRTMLKATATWQEIQAAWDGLTPEQQGIAAQKFNKDLKQHDPKTHARLIAMFEKE